MSGENDVTTMLSVAEFCDTHRISRSFFYKLQGEDRRAGRDHGSAPRTVKIGRRTLISGADARRWRDGLEGQGSAARASNTRREQ